PSNDRKGENKKKRRKDSSKPSSRSTRKDKSPMVHALEDTPADQPQDQKDVHVKNHPNLGRFTKNSGTKDRIPYTMSGAEKGIVCLNQHNYQSLMKLNEVYKFCNGTLMKIQDNLIEMVKKNELGRGNKRLKGRDWNEKNIKRSTKMLDKTDQVMKHRE
nr:hypothetical protein [Tanacetum cinerariifolium]